MLHRSSLHVTLALRRLANHFLQKGSFFSGVIHSLCAQANMGGPPKKLDSIACTVITTDMNNGFSFAFRLAVEVLVFFILPPLVSFKD